MYFSVTFVCCFIANKTYCTYCFISLSSYPLKWPVGIVFFDLNLCLLRTQGHILIHISLLFFTKKVCNIIIVVHTHFVFTLYFVQNSAYSLFTNTIRKIVMRLTSVFFLIQSNKSLNIYNIFCVLEHIHLLINCTTRTLRKKMYSLYYYLI